MERKQHVIDAGVNEEQFANLIKLIEFLESDDIPPPRFAIEAFMTVPANTDGLDESDEDDLDERRSEIYSHYYTPAQISAFYTKCGTTACAVGHGPLAGIPILDFESWPTYSNRVFGIATLTSGWQFMFTGSWTGENNTAKGTAKRMRWWLEHGTPEAFVYYWTRGEKFDWSAGEWLK